MEVGDWSIVGLEGSCEVARIVAREPESKPWHLACDWSAWKFDNTGNMKSGRIITTTHQAGD